MSCPYITQHFRIDGGGVCRTILFDYNGGGVQDTFRKSAQYLNKCICFGKDPAKRFSVTVFSHEGLHRTFVIGFGVYGVAGDQDMNRRFV